MSLKPNRLSPLDIIFRLDFFLITLIEIYYIIKRFHQLYVPTFNFIRAINVRAVSVLTRKPRLGRRIVCANANITVEANNNPILALQHNSKNLCTRNYLCGRIMHINKFTTRFNILKIYPQRGGKASQII
jgi:hypothetical protein